MSRGRCQTVRSGSYIGQTGRACEVLNRERPLSRKRPVVTVPTALDGRVIEGYGVDEHFDGKQVKGTWTMNAPALIAAVLVAALWLSCQAQQRVEYLKEEPAKGSIPHGKVVYVDDHTCPKGQVKEVTGGSEQKGIPRRLRCVKKPG